VKATHEIHHAIRFFLLFLTLFSYRISFRWASKNILKLFLSHNLKDTKNEVKMKQH